jgi:hypothetical protein
MGKATISSEFESILAKLGIRQRSIHRIRFGGVVGKQALVAFGGILVLAVVANKTSEPNLLWGCAIGGVALALCTITAMGFHGHKHPVEATLEGGEIIAWKHIEQNLAAKGLGELPSSNAVAEGIGDRNLEAQNKGEKV